VTLRAALAQALAALAAPRHVRREAEGIGDFPVAVAGGGVVKWMNGTEWWRGNDIESGEELGGVGWGRDPREGRE